MLHEALFELRPGGPWYTTDDEWFWTGDESDKPTDADKEEKLFDKKPFGKI